MRRTVVVILVAVAILTFIMLFIIPKFEKIFKDFNMTLPEMTMVQPRSMTMMSEPE